MEDFFTRPGRFHGGDGAVRLLTGDDTLEVAFDNGALIVADKPQALTAQGTGNTAFPQRLHVKIKFGEVNVHGYQK